MPNLKHLEIDVTQINKIGIKLKKLKHVNIDNINYKIFHDIKINSLKNLINIEYLKLGPRISILLSSTNFINLKKLYLGYCISMKDEHIENLVNLEALIIYNNKNITENAFKNLNKIKVLILFETNITARVLQYLPNIECWSPDNINNDDGHKYIKSIKKLKILDLSFNNNIINEDIKNTKIEHIILCNNEIITINGLDKDIKKIDLCENNKIKDKDLKQLNLIYLNLQENKTITNNGLKHLKNLKMLNLFLNKKITDKALIYMKNLEYLNLKMTGIQYDWAEDNRITDLSLKKLIKLKYLNLENNINITNDGIKPLVNLEYLNIRDNKK